MKSVTLLRARPPNMAGEVCGFEDELADQLIASGHATAVQTPEEAKAAEKAAAKDEKEEAEDKAADKADKEGASARATVVGKPAQTTAVSTPAGAAVRK